MFEGATPSSSVSILSARASSTGAACDVFDEGAQDDSGLLGIDTFVASPHADATTVESIERMGLAAVQEVLRLLGSEGGADHEGDDL